MPTRIRRETAETANGTGGSEVLAEVRDKTLEHLSGTQIEIDGEVVHVGKLCIDQLVALSRFGVRLWKVVGSSGLEPVLAEMTRKPPEVVRDEDPDASAERRDRDKAAMDAALAKVSGAAVLDSIVDVLTEEQIGDLFGVIVDMPSAWCRKHIGLPDIFRIGEAVMEHNDWQTLVAYFNRAARRLGLSTTPSSKP